MVVVVHRALHQLVEFLGGRDPSQIGNMIIDYVTIATTGNAIDFGNLTEARRVTNWHVLMALVECLLVVD